MNTSHAQPRMKTSLGDLIAAIYEAAFDELGDERLARRVAAALVTDVLRRARV